MSLVDRQGMPRFLRSPCTDPLQGKEQFILGMSNFGIPWAFSLEEMDIDRIQTLLKETIYFNLFTDHLISYFTLILFDQIP